jgi:hypothetical protein
MDPNALTAAAAMVTALATLVLAGITFCYLRQTERMVGEARQQRLDATLPLLIFRNLRPLHQGPRRVTDHDLSVDLTNIGRGPALELNVCIIGNGTQYLPFEMPNVTASPPPLTVKADETEPVSFIRTQSQEHPSPTDGELMQAGSVGTLEAAYRDIHLRPLVSRAALRCTWSGSQLELALGPLEIVRPNSASGHPGRQ